MARSPERLPGRETEQFEDKVILSNSTDKEGELIIYAGKSGEKAISVYNGSTGVFYVDATSTTIKLIGGSSTPIQIGDAGSTSHGLAANDDLFVSGKLEVDGYSYFDESTYHNMHVYIKENTLLFVGIAGEYSTEASNVQTGGYTYVLATSNANTVLITTRTNYRVDHLHATETNPTIFLHSATDPTVDATQYIKLQHNQTDGVITTGKGNLLLSPAGAVNVDGSLELQRTAVAADYTTAGDTIIGVTDTSAARTITLATADCVEGRTVIVKDESGGAGTNNITVATEGTEKIDGADTQVINADYGVLRLYSDGANWFLM